MSPGMSPSRSEVILAYRHVYKHLLRAVQYSKPARFVARDRVRRVFRKSTEENYDASRIARTLQFLDAAAKVKGLEHKIVKNLMHVWWEQQKFAGPQLCVPSHLLKSKILHADEAMLGREKLWHCGNWLIVTFTKRSGCWTKAWAFALDRTTYLATLDERLPVPHDDH